MFAERANKVVGKGVAFVNVSAYLADIALLAFRLRLGLDVVKVIGISHRGLVADNARFGHGADKHSVRAEIDILLDFQRERGVDITRKDDKPVVGTDGIAVRKLIDVSSALESEGLKDGERRIDGKAVDVHLAGLFDDMVRIVILIYIDRDQVRSVGNLSDRVDDKTVVAFSVVRGNDIKAVTDAEARYSRGRVPRQERRRRLCFPR